jgi:hypothetical protein
MAEASFNLRGLSARPACTRNRPSSGATKGEVGRARARLIREALAVASRVQIIMRAEQQTVVLGRVPPLACIDSRLRSNSVVPKNSGTKAV